MSKTPSTAAPLPQIKPPRLRTFHARLAAWYQAHGRHTLPWRTTEDAYAIWLSEVMLQQTQVATVLERFYFPFLAKFPTIEALANAPREAVMKAWEGLGYYRRAGFLHDAAQQMVASASPPLPHLTRNDPAIALPDDDASLLALPGIGRNTAHAILAFAYRQPVAILEANVKRIVARIFALETPSEAQLWAGAEALLNKHEAFNHNQAMMDLGSMLCRPRNPDCPACPANAICAGKASPESYPAPRVKKQVPVREVTIHVIEDAAGKFHLEARDAALLGGLYGFPQTAPSGTPLPVGEVKIALAILGEGRALGHVTQIYSHFRLEGRVMHHQLTTTKRGPQWHTRAQIGALPLSGVDHKVLALVDNSHTAQKKQVKTRARRSER